MQNHVFKKVKNIQFGLVSPKLIKQISVCKVVTPELYDAEGYPVDGGLMDTRMGVIDPGLRCRTDGRKLRDCPGYFGHIELARPVVHVKFAPLILTLLRCTCRECGRILIPKARIEQALGELKVAEQEAGLDGRRAKVKEIIAESRGTKCPYCNAKQKKVAIDKPSTFLENEKKVSPIEVRARLEKITDDDLELFGINHNAMRPEWTILTMLLIPPVTMRPSITLETGERSEDDLTHKLGDIVRINQRLFENINAGAPEIIVEDLWELLQYHVTTFFDNTVAQVPPARHRNGQPLKTIASRIKSKEGRIRHNLAGKRTNFSARTVISPDPNLEINEVGIPESVAQKLSVPERVTEWNMDYLKKFIQNGPKTYPGSNYIVRPDGTKKRVTDETKEALLEEVQPGFTVERQLMDGDIAIFNRQPSLHKMSMMCHKVRVLPGKTFRLHPGVCNPYNADFDGDEMNLHIPQTEEARAEAELLMQVQTQIVSPRYGLSIIGCMQDGVSGNFVLTQDGYELPRDKAVELLYRCGHTDFSRLPDKANVSGKDVFSCILPDTFNFNGKDKQGNTITIRKGQLQEGAMDIANLGGGKGKLLRSLHKKYGPDEMSLMLGKMFKLGIETLQDHGLTASVADIDLPTDVVERIETIINKAQTDTKKLIAQYEAGKLEQLSGRSMKETLELRILEVLNIARNDAGTLVAEYAKEGTGTGIMINRGGRGSNINLAQISACVGQQALRGNRIALGFKDRTLSCFKRNDLGADAHGFIRHGFKHGMDPAEFFFQAMAGRDSLMDTALRTPKSGYLYRRLANAMQDLRIGYDGTVRDASGKIVQFAYGDDKIDVSASEGGDINVRGIIEEVLM